MLSGILWIPIRYVTLHFRDRRWAASLLYRNRAEITVLSCEQKPYLHGFRAEQSTAKALLFITVIRLVWTRIFVLKQISVYMKRGLSEL